MFLCRVRENREGGTWLKCIRISNKPPAINCPLLPDVSARRTIEDGAPSVPYGPKHSLSLVFYRYTLPRNQTHQCHISDKSGDWAPELLPTPKSDVYAFAMLCYEVMTVFSSNVDPSPSQCKWSMGV